MQIASSRVSTRRIVCAACVGAVFLVAGGCGTDGNVVSLPDAGEDASFSRAPDAGSALDGAVESGADSDARADATTDDSSAPPARSPVDSVNPFMGTGEVPALDYGINNAGGHTFPGAVAPFGMLAWSPDTTNQAGGYRYSNDTIFGFSLTHFSGRGVSCYQDFPVMPTIGTPGASPGATWGSFASKFRHETESARPGYYGVTLDASAVQVELTATQRTGFGRFTYPPGSAATLLLNAGGSANGDAANGTQVAITGSDSLAGSAVSGNCGGAFLYKIYFAARFDRPFAQSGTWSGATLTPGGAAAAGPQSGAYFTFDTSVSPVVQLKVGLSYVSIANAQANLAAESPGFSFEAIEAATSRSWNDRLSSVAVTGGTRDQQSIFYTSLYHSFIHPSVFSDANGDYVGFDGVVRTLPKGRAQYHNLSSWDNYRALMPLLAVLAPKEASDMMQSLVNDAMQDPGGGLPRWEHANANSGGMVGDHQDAAIASVYAFGARDFDAAGALSAMKKGASDPTTTSTNHLVRDGLADYLAKGYVPTYVGGSAAITLDYAVDDFAVSRLAAALGDDASAAHYLAQAQNWKNLWQNGWLVPRKVDGSFVAPWAPTDTDNWVESDGAQYVWMVPFNLRALFDKMGGDAAAIGRLDMHTMQLNAGRASPYLFIGNEPELEVPWEYDFAGAPSRTQDVVRRILLEQFQNAPTGMPGNDDGGAIGAWVVWGALGLYPEIPGVGGLAVGSPQFKSAQIRLPLGKTLTIDAPDASDAARYVTSLTLAGQPIDSPWIPWSSLASGGTLTFSLATAPNPAWGTAPAPAPESAPPSFDAP